MAEISKETRKARNWYSWLWISPLFTLPTLAIAFLFVFFSDLSIVMALLLPALWHLVLLIPSLNKQSDLIRWHGRQALVLAGIRTAIPAILVLSVGDDEGILWSIPILLAVWLFGTLWGQKQAGRGECSLAKWLGEEISLAPPELAVVIGGDEDPDALVEVIRFSRDTQKRKTALLELAKLGMVEGLDQVSAKLPGGATAVTEGVIPVAKKGRGYVWLILVGVVIALLVANSIVNQRLEARSAAAAATAAARSFARMLVRDGEDLAEEGDIEGALALYARAQSHDPGIEISAGSWNYLCWLGSLWGYASQVMHTCENAVASDPTHGGIRDSRGLARALTGDPAGAVEDFHYFVEWARGEGWNPRIIQKRESWIEQLEAGINPFDAQTLEALRPE